MPTPDDIIVEKDGDNWVVAAEYTRETELFGNLSLRGALQQACGHPVSRPVPMAAPQVNDGARDEALAAWLARALLGRDLKRFDLCRAALTHRSFHHDNNERLEFFGDAVLGMVVAEELLRRFPAASEGTLSRLRARLVSTGPLAAIGLGLGIGPIAAARQRRAALRGFRRESHSRGCHRSAVRCDLPAGWPGSGAHLHPWPVRKNSWMNCSPKQS